MKLCSVEGCERKLKGNGLCNMHWLRSKRGKPLCGDPKNIRLGLRREHFTPGLIFSLVYTEPNTGCWIWPLGMAGGGYGALNDGGKIIPAHCLSWEVHHGTIPQGKKVLHKCDVRLCINPGHLFLGSQKDNLEDAIKKGRAVHIREMASRGGLAAPKGEEHSGAILTADQVKMIRSAERKYGFRRKLAQEYGVSESTIQKVLYGENWRHVQ